jgi:hypothetical protein
MLGSEYSFLSLTGFELIRFLYLNVSIFPNEICNLLHLLGRLGGGGLCLMVLMLTEYYCTFILTIDG